MDGHLMPEGNGPPPFPRQYLVTGLGVEGGKKCPLPVGASSPQRSHKNQDNIPIWIGFGVEASSCTRYPCLPGT